VGVDQAAIDMISHSAEVDKAHAAHVRRELVDFIEGRRPGRGEGRPTGLLVAQVKHLKSSAAGSVRIPEVSDRPGAPNSLPRLSS